MLESFCSNQFALFIEQKQYIPFFISFLALAAAYACAKTINRLFLTGEKSFQVGKKEGFKITLDRFKSTTPPAFALFFLGIGSAVSQRFVETQDLLTVLITCTFIWFVLTFVWALTSNRSITSLVAVFFAAAIPLNLFGLLTPTVTLLNAWSLHIGSYTITLYQILKGLLLLIILLLITRKASNIGQRYIHKLPNVNVNTRELLAKLFQTVLYFIALVIVLDVMGLNLTSLTIFSSAVAVGVGFSIQKIASNLLSGLTLLFEKSIEIGDILELKDGSWAWVRHLGARATLLECLDGREVIMPNDDLITLPVTNLSHSHPRLRIEIKIHIPYSADLELARRLIWEAALSAPLCSKTMPPDCFLNLFSEHGAVFLVHVWTDDVTRGRFRPQSEAMFAIWKKLREHGIEIPYQVHDVTLRTVPTKNGEELSEGS